MVSQGLPDRPYQVLQSTVPAEKFRVPDQTELKWPPGPPQSIVPSCTIDPLAQNSAYVHIVAVRPAVVFQRVTRVPDPVIVMQMFPLHPLAVSGRALRAAMSTWRPAEAIGAHPTVAMPTAAAPAATRNRTLGVHRFERRSGLSLSKGT
jgi:hypothetical protein